MTPEQLAKGNSEHGHQTALFAWAALNFASYPELRWMFAIPNGGLRDKISAANLKAEGARAGVPDILLPVSVGKWHGLFIEMKRPEDKSKKQRKGTVSDDQERWIEALGKLNYGVVVAYTWDQARDYIIQYLTWKG